MINSAGVARLPLYKVVKALRNQLLSFLLAAHP